MENIPVEITPELIPVIIIGAIQLLKRIPQMMKIKEWFPIIGIGIGIGLSFYMRFENPIVLGLITGLVAAKSYDILKKPAAKIVKSTVAGKKAKKS